MILRSGQSREQRAEHSTTASCSVQLQWVVFNCVQLCAVVFSWAQLCAVVFGCVQSRSAAAVCSMLKACWREVFSCSQRASSSSSSCTPLLRPTPPVSCARATRDQLPASYCSPTPYWLPDSLLATLLSCSLPPAPLVSRPIHSSSTGYLAPLLLSSLLSALL